MVNSADCGMYQKVDVESDDMQKLHNSKDDAVQQSNDEDDFNEILYHFNYDWV